MSIPCPMDCGIILRKLDLKNSKYYCSRCKQFFTIENKDDKFVEDEKFEGNEEEVGIEEE